MRFVVKSRRVVAVLALVLAPGVSDRDGTRSFGQEPRSPLQGVRRVVFLGDSITYAGGYIDFVEAYLKSVHPSLRTEFLDLGLPSETVSGLTEPGHAGGKFPRPDLHERLERVLSKTKPDLVVACYGMNDGIYHPFDEGRFRKYEDGIRDLRRSVEAHKARIVHLTPPVFDPLPIQARTLPAGLSEYRQPFEGYDDVLERYSRWLLSQREAGWDVVDVHGPMKRYLDEHRRRDAAFRLAGDGVHADATGHWIIAREVLKHWGESPEPLDAASGGERALEARPHGLTLLSLVRERQRLTKDAWLSASGHTRPGMKRGIPLEQAERQASELDAKIASLAAGS